MLHFEHLRNNLIQIQINAARIAGNNIQTYRFTSGNRRLAINSSAAPNYVDPTEISKDEFSKIIASLLLIFQLRWDRAYLEILNVIDSKVAKQSFKIAIGISIVILIVGLINLVRGFMR